MQLVFFPKWQSHGKEVEERLEEKFPVIFNGMEARMTQQSVIISVISRCGDILRQLKQLKLLESHAAALKTEAIVSNVR